MLNDEHGTGEATRAASADSRKSLLVLWTLAGFAMAVAVLWSLALAHATPERSPTSAQGEQPAGNPALWRPIWDEMMPVFTGPRCLNCHGVTNPATGDGHGGGSVEGLFIGSAGERFFFQPAGYTCAGCHTARSVEEEIDGRKTRLGPWRLAPEDVWFVGKDAPTVCRQLIRRGPGSQVQHASEDPLIQLAFEGMKGGASEVAEPPPIGHQAFVTLIRRWVTEAALACDLNGTLTITETLRGSRRTEVPLSSLGSGTITAEESGTRTVTVDVQNGRATGTVQGSASQQTRGRHVLRNCVTTAIKEHSISASGSGEARLDITIRPEGDYTINLVGPPESGSQRIHDRQESNCFGNLDDGGLQVPAGGPWPYAIEGRRTNPSDRVLSGNSTRTYVFAGSPAADGLQPWLLQGWAPAVDPQWPGSPPTVTVTATWNLTLE